jgi:ABC-type Fe3+ transport system substrate-binding protein
MEWLTGPTAQKEIVANSEMAANPDVAPPQHIADWADVKRDPIDVERAGKLLPTAIALMQKVGWK